MQGIGIALFLIAWLAQQQTAVQGGFVGRIDECGDTAANDCARTSVSFIPTECRNMSMLVEQLSSGAFVPSLPERWTLFQNVSWHQAPDRSELVAESCDIPREAASKLSPERFKETYHERQPVVIVLDAESHHSTNPSFVAMTTKPVMLYCFADFDITLSTANKNSYNKYEATFRHYVTAVMKPQTLDSSGLDTMYFFGDNRHDEWAVLFDHYARPMRYIWSHVSLSFGIGASGTGVPFHTHGAVFAEVMHGEKRWFLQAPGPEPVFDPDQSSLTWLKAVYPSYTHEQRHHIMDCVVKPGELLYIPSFWHHATLNIGEAVFMSSFV